MHSVIHYCAHQPANDRPLIWLHDLTLLARGLDPSGWAELDRKVRIAQLAGLHVAALKLAAEAFPLELPAALLQDWYALGARECTNSLLRVKPGPVQRGLQSLSCITSLRGRIAYLRARLFPPVDWMRGRYGATNALQLSIAYLYRWADGLRQAVRPRP
jgi:hypothetical protein